MTVIDSAPPAQEAPPSMNALLFAVRYGLPAALFVAGIVVWFAAPESTRWDGWGMCWGSAIALVAWNVLFRIGFSGDDEREKEEAARRYLTKHGRWPVEDDEA